MSHGECPACHEKFHSQIQIDEHVCCGGKELETKEAEERCGNCKYYYEHKGRGKCRRYPPFTYKSTMEDRGLLKGGHKINQANHTIILSQWPPVCSVDWCGEFKAKER